MILHSTLLTGTQSQRQRFNLSNTKGQEACAKGTEAGPWSPRTEYQTTWTDSPSEQDESPRAPQTSVPGHINLLPFAFNVYTHIDDFLHPYKEAWGVPGGSLVKNLPTNARDTGSIPGSGRSPGKGNDNPLQYSCLGNPMDRGAWRAIYSPWGHKESYTT